jgi:hypothetical protein
MDGRGEALVMPLVMPLVGEGLMRILRASREGGS